MRVQKEKRAPRDGRVRTVFDNMPLMRSFFLYAAGCVLASLVVSSVLILGLMSTYDTFQRAAWKGRVDVEGGPYVYDAATDELIPAVAIELSSATEMSDRIAFLGMRDRSDGGLLVGDGSGGVINAETGASIGYATLKMVRSDPSLTVYDWAATIRWQIIRKATVPRTTSSRSTDPTLRRTTRANAASACR